MITELRKRTKDGRPYTRRPNISALLEELATLGKGELVERCRRENRTRPDYVPSECLLYFVRANRNLPDSDHSESLFKLLFERVLRGLPADPPGGVSESFSKGELREAVFERFIGMLLEDRRGYDEKLDYFEVGFDGGLAKLKLTALRDLARVSGGVVSLENETGGPSPIDVKAETLYKISEAEVNISNPLYRIPLQSAIDKLPLVQQRITQMLLMGFTIDSNDPSEQTVSKVLGFTEKTIRTQRDKALVALQADLNDAEDI